MDLQTLHSWIREGRAIDYLFFWGHRQKTMGKYDASCMSQWFASPFRVQGVTYKTAEHWMMAGKAQLFGDEENLAKILKAPDPGTAKALGRKVRGFNEAKWIAARSELVMRGNVEKFGQNAGLRAFLLGTGTKVLVEASPRDRIWGIGMGASNPDARNPSKWKGLNLLGFALMHAREELGGALAPV